MAKPLGVNSVQLLYESSTISKVPFLPVISEQHMLNHPNQNLTIRHEGGGGAPSHQHHPQHNQHPNQGNPGNPGNPGQQLGAESVHNNLTAPKKRLTADQQPRHTQTGQSGPTHHQLNAQQVRSIN